MKAQTSSARVWGQRLGQSKELFAEQKPDLPVVRSSVRRENVVVRSRAFLIAAVLGCLTALFALVGCASSEAYQPKLGTPTLSAPAIGQADTLRVGVNTNKSPLAGMGTDKIIGIDVDIAAALADEFGLTLEIQDVGTETEAALSDGDVDLVMGIDSSESLDGVELTEQYIPTAVALFTLANSTAAVPTGDSKPKIAAQVSSKSAWAVTNEFGDDALDSTSDLASAFAALKAGTVQYVASDAVVGLYAANREGVDVKIAALMDNPTGYCVAVAANNKELKDAVSSALASLKTNGLIDVIEKKWLGQALDLSNIQKTAGSTQSSAAVTTDETTADETTADGDISTEEGESSEQSA